ncbi:flavin reductase family protein [Amorphus sp. 3PC139-8]|uniref:flavin reductase family protein n=1 Tax=Amorphus sp. 3PC139-8 TaxID=2735676 RepID=UPI00345CFF0A
MEVELDPLSPKERYKLLCGLVVPRPIALITTVSVAGEVNAAPFSFFNVVSHDPPLVVLGLDRRESGEPKDTLINIQKTKEFVVNLVGEQIAAQMNICGSDYPAGINELEEAGLEASPSSNVAPPRITVSLACLECKLKDELIYGERGQRSIIVGEIVSIHAQDGLINERFHVSQDILKPIGRMAGSEYTSTKDRFSIAANHNRSWQL